MSKKKKKKAKKEKVIYYDDQSTVIDMSSVNRKGEKREPPPKRDRASNKERWQTFTDAVKQMLIPMFVVLAVLAAIFLLLYYVGQCAA